VLAVPIPFATLALAGRFLGAEPQNLVTSNVDGFFTRPSTMVALAGCLLAAFVFTVARRVALGASIAALVSVCCLFGKTYPTAIRANTFAIDYAHHAVELGPLRDKFIANRWLPSWIAHWLGFRTTFGWLVFLVATFLVGVVVLYAAIRRRGHDPIGALLLTTIPAVTVTGWYGVSVAGYTDWVLFAVLAGAVFVRSWRVAAILAALSLWVHERALCVIVLLPLLRAILADRVRPRELLSFGSWLVFAAVAYFGLRGSVSEASSGSVAHYVAQLRGNSIFTIDRPLSAALIGEAVLEAYKALLLVPVLFVIANVLMKPKLSARSVFRWGLLLGFVPILAQVAVAVDTVRLMDLLVLPIVVAAISIYEQWRERRRAVHVFVAACLAATFVTPLHYSSQNWNFHPRGRANVLCAFPWSCDAAMDLRATARCESPTPRVVFAWISARSFDAQWLDVRLVGTDEIHAYDAGLSRSPQRSLELDWSRAREWRVNTRWNGVWHPTEWQRVPPCGR